LAVIVLAICHPAAIERAVVPSCARVIVSVSPVTFVTRTISEIEAVGVELLGQSVALNGTAGNKEPCPAVTTKLVPLVAGVGAVTTVE